MSKLKNFYFLSEKDVKALVKSVLGSEFILTDYYFRRYSEEKKGFMGSHWGLVVEVKNKKTSEVENKKFFIKTIPYDPDNEHEQPALNPTNGLLFYKETNFYKHVVPELTLCVKNSSWCARCFMVTDEILVFEDLKDKNFKLKSGILDTRHLKSALTGLAKLHASSVLAEARLGKTFSELYPRIMEESLFTKKTRMIEWITRGIESSVAIARKCGYTDVELIPEVCNELFEAVSASKKWRNVICHGDAWSNNLMFDDSEPLPVCAMVDYQMIRYAPAMTDVVQLFYLTTRQDYRKNNEKMLLKHYHEVFSEIIQENEPQAQGLQSFEELLLEYEDTKIVGMITVLLYFPTPLACEILSEDFVKECNGLDALLYDDRIDIVMSMLKKHPEFDDRISEVMVEFMDKVKQRSALSASK